MTASNFKPGAKNDTWELISPIVNTWAGTTMTVSNIVYDADPLIYNNILVQNNTLVNQIYSVTVSLPTVFGAPNLIRGSIDTSLIGTTATVSTVAPTPIYSAQIDFGTVQTLQDHPFSLSTPAGAVSSSASFGYQVNFVPVTSSIGIQLRFELTPGDTVAIVSDFEIIPVPEPGTLALLVLGGSALLLRRQRR